MPFHNFRGQRHGRPQQQSGGFSQAKMRHTVHTKDQDGRNWWFSAENATGMPCSVIQPLFSAPWSPDPQYIIVNPANTSECYIDYLAIARDRMRAMREYHRKAVELASKKGWDVPVLGDYSDDLVAAHPMGVPPRAFQLAIAAEQGNPWVLGQRKKPDPRLERYLELPSREDVAALQYMDFSAASYDEAVGGEGGEKTPQRAAFSRRKPITFEELEGHTSVVDELADELDREELENADAMRDFESLDDGDDEGLLESIPSEDEGPEASLEDASQDDDEPLVDDDEEDPEALGGRTVKPGQEERARKQAPRRPSQTAVPRKRATARSAGKDAAPSGRKSWNPAGRKTLADGAAPVVAE